jgi:hypothetical protein
MRQFIFVFILGCFSLQAEAQWNALPYIGGEDILQIKRLQSNTYCVANVNALYTSPDTGRTWSKVNGVNYAASLDINPQGVFVGTAGDGVAYSINNGASWTWINSGLPWNAYYSAVAMMASNQDYQYAAVVSNGLYRRSLSSLTWQQVLADDGGVKSLVSNGNYIYFLANGLQYSSDNGNNWQGISTPYLPITIDVFNDTLWLGTSTNGLFYSVDHGVTMVLSDNGIPLGGSPVSKPRITHITHSDDKIFVVAKYNNTPGDVIFYSVNNGADWLNLTSYIYTDNIVGIIQADDKIAVASRMNGVWSSSDDGSSWSFSRLVGSNSEITGMDYDQGLLYTSSKKSGFAVSEDYGYTWTPRNVGLPMQYYTGISADNGQVCIMGQMDGVYCSVDTGKTWVFKGGGDGKVIYVKNGRLFVGFPTSFKRCNVVGGTLSSVTLPGAMTATGVYSDGTNVFVGSTNAFFKSVDNGNTFVTMTLPSGVTGKVTDFAKCGSDLYAYVEGNTMHKILKSSDFGNTWSIHIDFISSGAQLFELVTFVHCDDDQLIFNSPNKSSAFGFLNYSPDFGQSIYHDLAYNSFNPWNGPSKMEYDDSLVFVQMFQSLAYTFKSNIQLDTVSGFVFNDLNTNGIQDVGEPVMPNVSVIQSNSGEYAFTDTLGFFQFKGYYHFWNVALAAASPNISCEPQLHTGTLSNQHCHFGVYVTPGIVDAKLYLLQMSSFRHGYTGMAKLICFNNGNDTLNTNIKLKIVGPAEFESVSPPASLWPDSVEIQLNNFLPLHSKVFDVVVQVDIASQVGDSITIIASFDPIALDNVPYDNLDTLFAQVSSSYDPNEKKSSYPRKVSQQFLTQNPEIPYIVRFQNTGNDTAVHVVIRDTVNTLNYLLRNSFRYMTSSHPCVVSFEAHNIIVFTFRHIMLPDSTTDEVNSNGFVAFWLRPFPNIPLNSFIRNRAAIFFDFNEPVITNYDSIQKVAPQTLIQNYTLDNSFQVFPNPVSSSFSFVSDLAGELHVYDAAGSLKLIVNVVQGMNSIDISFLSDGLYFVKMTTEKNRYYSKVLKINNP